MPTRAWHCQRLALVSAQLSFGPMIGDFMELRINPANSSVGQHSLGDPLVVINWDVCLARVALSGKQSSDALLSLELLEFK